jgi:hypothetical protein
MLKKAQLEQPHYVSDALLNIIKCRGQNDEENGHFFPGIDAFPHAGYAVGR